MIKLIRLDERMIHGQVATRWSRLLGVDRIIVANDEAAKNSLVRQSLMMAAPNGIKAAVVSVDQMIAMMKDPKAADHDILIIVSRPQDLLKAVQNVDGIRKINVGNYGRSAEKKNGEPRKAYEPNLYAYPEEAEIFRQVAACGIPASYQTIPEDPEDDLAKLFAE